MTTTVIGSPTGAAAPPPSVPDTATGAAATQTVSPSSNSSDTGGSSSSYNGSASQQDQIKISQSDAKAVFDVRAEEMSPEDMRKAEEFARQAAIKTLQRIRIERILENLQAVNDSYAPEDTEDSGTAQVDDGPTKPLDILV